jgi:quercetin dioxygenase-like cupin family protein
MKPWSLRSRLLLALTFGALVVTAGFGSAQQPQGPGRQGASGGQGGGRGNFASNFTGTVAVQDSANMRMSRIRFEAGARTNWHVHTTGQLLLVEDGKGRLYEQGGQIVELQAGQPVYTKANVPHWHGAAPDQHAVQFSVYSGDLEWRNAVTDDEYTGKTRR